LDLVPARAERIFVGKMRDRHVLPQDGINQLLVQLATAGKRVLRLKGGDPFIFGRGGEELETLARAGIAFEVVPGITAALGCAAYAGIPLTHRDQAQALVFVTGHTKDDKLDLDWAMLARPRQTVVIYMGVKALAQLCTQLIDHGLAATTPAAVVENGTYERQRVISGSLETLPDLTPDQHLVGPAVIIVGEVVTHHSRLGWLAAPIASRDTALLRGDAD
jgi:uroporphyrin-III C-methyltransferase/precorrin-2 dehydrogenase/sirohydrochlorin ferrochelatase